VLNESVGAGYIDRNWPPALKDSGAWPLTSLRQSFLNGSLTRLIDPDAILRKKIVEFIGKGDFGLASGPKSDGTYERIWIEELIAPEEVGFESGVFLMKKERAKALKGKVVPEPIKPIAEPFLQPEKILPEVEEAETKAPSVAKTCTLRLAGTIPPELWNRLGTKILPKLRSGKELQVGIDFQVSLKADQALSMKSDISQILDDLGLSGRVRIEES
jgi:hypothetical protein